MSDFWDLLIVTVSTVALAISSRLVTNGIDTLWEAQRWFYWLANRGAVPFGGNKDIPVLLVVGMMAGWFALFLADGTKRIQAAIVLVIGSGSVGARLLETGRIVEAIGRSPTSFAIGLTIGLVSGAVSARLFGVKRPKSMGIFESLAWVQFDSAAEAFRHSVSAIVILAAIDYSLISPIPNSVDFIAASMTLLISLSVFVQYDYQKTVFAVAPPDPHNSDRYFPYVFGGLFDRARRFYHGFTIKGGAILNQAMKVSKLSNLPDRFDRTVAFGFATGIQTEGRGGIEKLGAKLLPKTARIESEGITTDKLPSLSPSRDSNRIYFLSRLTLSRVASHLVKLIPAFIRDRFPSRGRSKIDKLDRADVVLLIGPTILDEPVPEETAVFDDICARYSEDPTTEVVLATTEAPDDSVGDHDTRVNAMENLDIDRDNLSWTNVYPLARFEEHDGDEFKDLLDRLSE